MPSPRKPPKTPETMGWFEMLAELKKLYDYSGTIQAQMKSNIDIWQQRIDELKPMIEKMKTLLKVLDLEDGELKKEIKVFFKMAEETMAKGKGIRDIVETPKLYYVHDKKQADAIQPSSAIVIYRKSNTLQLYLRKPNSSYVPLTSWKVSRETMTSLGWLYNKSYPVTRQLDGEIIGEPGTNMGELISELKKSAGINASPKQLLAEVVRMGQDVPSLMMKFFEINESLQKVAQLKLEAFSKQAEQFDLHESFQHPILTKGIEQANQFMQSVEKKLEEILDPAIYKKYFSGQLEEREEKKEDSENQHWIEDAGKSLAALKKIIEKLAALQKKPNEEIKDLFFRLQFQKKQLNDVALATQEFITIINKIKENPILNTLISDIKEKSIVDRLIEMEIPGVDFLKNKLENKLENNDPVLDEVEKEEKEEELTEELTLKYQVKQLKSMIETISKISRINIEKKTHLSEPLERMEKLSVKLDELYEMSEREREEPNFLKFVYTNFSEIKTTASQLLDSIENLKHLSREEAGKIALQINEALKNMLLLSDRVEIQLCLKEGIITDPLKTIISKAYDQLKKQGYDFLPENRYPYTESIFSQRNYLSELPTVHKELIKKRLVPPEQEEKLLRNDEVIREEVNKLITKHIAYLSKSPSHTRNKKIKLLEMLLVGDEPFEEKLNLLRLNRKTSEDFYLLYEGTTGHILKKISLQNAPPEIILHELSTELIKLKKQRGKIQYFYSKNAIALEDKIQIFEKLQMLIETNSLKDALGKLEPSERSILKKYDAFFIKNLEKLEEDMHSENRLKTILGADKANVKVKIKDKPDHKAELPDSLSGEQERAHAIQLLDERIDELKASNAKENTIKKEMLVDLKNYLIAHKSMSIDAAILKLKSKPDTENAKNIYLLYEGNLGKTIKLAQNLTITRDELILRLDVELHNMNKQRYNRLYLFSTSRKQELDARIKVLKDIKAELKTPGHRNSVSDIVTKHKDVLKHYEPDLVEELEKFKNVFKWDKPPSTANV